MDLIVSGVDFLPYCIVFALSFTGLSRGKILHEVTGAASACLFVTHNIPQDKAWMNNSWLYQDNNSYATASEA